MISIHVHNVMSNSELFFQRIFQFVKSEVLEISGEGHQIGLPATLRFLNVSTS